MSINYKEENGLKKVFENYNQSLSITQTNISIFTKDRKE